MDENRQGDHSCYISNLDKILSHYPRWSITVSLDDIFEGIYESRRVRK